MPLKFLTKRRATEKENHGGRFIRGFTDVDVCNESRNNHIGTFPALLWPRHFSPRCDITANSVKLADVERVLATGNAVTRFGVYCLSAMFILFVDDNRVDMDEVKKDGRKAAALLQSASFTSRRQDFCAASKQQSKLKEDD